MGLIPGFRFERNSRSPLPFSAHITRAGQRFYACTDGEGVIHFQKLTLDKPEPPPKPPKPPIVAFPLACPTCGDVGSLVEVYPDHIAFKPFPAPAQRDAGERGRSQYRA
jgi:hypothetical protein